MADRDTEKSSTSKPAKKSRPKRENIGEDHALKKRTTGKLIRSENHVYITNNTNIKAQLLKCTRLLESGHKDVIIHALGAAINRGLNLGLKLKTLYPGRYELEVNTSTKALIDDLHPLNDDADFATQERQNSVVHVRVFHTKPLPTEPVVSET